MKILPFKESALASVGMELELQIINPRTYSTVSRAKDLIRIIKESKYKNLIKPEITQSMIEINTSIHTSPLTMLEEMKQIQQFLLHVTSELDLTICGGGTHPFQKWSTQKIFPLPRYKRLLRQYRYLSKRSTVFGQHVHVGCPSSDDALYLTHAIARYVPHFIAMSASSPFYLGTDTGYASSRSTIFTAFPTSGVMPFLLNWDEFSAYFYKMKRLGIIETMKDFYWDIRPKPEYGTVELRVCDTPLTVKKSILLTAYIQTIAYYLLKERPLVPNIGLYHIYPYNRFQASRYGFEGVLIDFTDESRIVIADDILSTMKIIEKHANKLGTSYLLAQLMRSVLKKENDATRLRQFNKQANSLVDVVAKQCKIWAKE